ncbi:MAG: hypothetical protein LBT14_11685 [Treponema sp.]|jgi:hypothetical protein|nr:hypothetical protein [Treponema sp.]
MKKTVPISMFLLWGASLWAEKPLRYVEFGFDSSVGFASNYIGIGDIFNADQVVNLNLNTVPSGDFEVNADLGMQVFFNMNFGEKFGLGFFAGVHSIVYQSLSHTFLKFLSQGNGDLRQYTADITLGGSVFADTGIKASVNIGKLKVGISPALYVPILYMPKPAIQYRFDSVYDKLYLDVTADVKAYSPISLESLVGGSLDISSGAIMEILDAKGFDFSLNAEYALVPLFDVGGVVTHIPLMPAVLTHETHAAFHYRYDPDQDLLNSLLTGSFEFDTPELNDPVYSDDASFRVYRPLGFDFYVLFKPLRTNSVIIKPNIGFSLFTVYGEPCFNLGLEAQLRVRRLLTVRIGSFYQERIWRNQCNLGLNLRVFELDLGFGVQSQDLKGILDIKGLGVSVGLRMGF